MALASYCGVERSLLCFNADVARLEMPKSLVSDYQALPLAVFRALRNQGETAGTERIMSGHTGTRINLTLSKETEESLNEIIHTHADMSKTAILRKSLATYIELYQQSQNGNLIFVYDTGTDKTSEVVFKEINNSNFERPTILSPIESRKQARIYATVLVDSLTALLNEEGNRLHNRPPRDLRTVSDDTKLLKQLISELRKLNKILAAEQKVPEKQRLNMVKHLDKFLEGFAATAGRGSAGVLVAGAGASLMMFLGVDAHSVAGILTKIPKP